MSEERNVEKMVMDGVMGDIIIMHFFQTCS